MDLITALAVSIGVLGGIATFVFCRRLAWGCKFGRRSLPGRHSIIAVAGSQLSKALIHLIFGAVMAYIALLLVTQVPLGGALGVPLWAGICVLITVLILVYAAKSPT